MITGLSQKDISVIEMAGTTDCQTTEILFTIYGKLMERM